MFCARECERIIKDCLPLLRRQRLRERRRDCDAKDQREHTETDSHRPLLKRDGPTPGLILTFTAPADERCFALIVVLQARARCQDQVCPTRLSACYNRHALRLLTRTGAGTGGSSDEATCLDRYPNLRISSSGGGYLRGVLESRGAGAQSTRNGQLDTSQSGPR